MVQKGDYLLLKRSKRLCVVTGLHRGWDTKQELCFTVKDYYTDKDILMKYGLGILNEFFMKVRDIKTAKVLYGKKSTT